MDCFIGHLGIVAPFAGRAWDGRRPRRRTNKREGCWVSPTNPMPACSLVPTLLPLPRILHDFTNPQTPNKEPGVHWIYLHLLSGLFENEVKSPGPAAPKVERAWVASHSSPILLTITIRPRFSSAGRLLFAVSWLFCVSSYQISAFRLTAVCLPSCMHRQQQ